MHIVSTDEGQVLAAVQEWNENDTYSLYISDTPGVYFTRSLPNLRTSRGLAGNLIVDVYKVCEHDCMTWWCSPFKFKKSTILNVHKNMLCAIRKTLVISMAFSRNFWK